MTSSSSSGNIIISGQQQGTTVQTPQTSTGQAAPGGTVSSGTTTSGTTASGTAQITINESIAKPSIYSEAAILYDATTGQVLYEKNSQKAMYPASTTKLMTALLAAERLNLDDTVTYSQTATHGLESGAATVQLDTGDTLTVKDSLYALMLKSACEVANGLAEKVSGSQAAFAELMNQRAQQLGCKNTHFTNASGLNDASHYTTAYDMALITKAALDNETVRTIDQTLTYTLPASKNRGSLQITNGHKMLNPACSGMGSITMRDRFSRREGRKSFFAFLKSARARNTARAEPHSPFSRNCKAATTSNPWRQRITGFKRASGRFL